MHVIQTELWKWVTQSDLLNTGKAYLFNLMLSMYKRKCDITRARSTSSHLAVKGCLSSASQLADSSSNSPPFTSALLRHRGAVAPGEGL